MSGWRRRSEQGGLGEGLWDNTRDCKAVIVLVTRKKFRMVKKSMDVKKRHTLLLNHRNMIYATFTVWKKKKHESSAFQ